MEKQATQVLGNSMERHFVLESARQVILVVGASLFVALCAHITIPLPFTPVPLTLQNFAVLLVGLMLGSRRGFAALALYLAEGAVGLPVFNPIGPGGIVHLFGPTGGFLLAYPLVAWVSGYVMEHGERSFRSRRHWRHARRNCAFHWRSGLARGSHPFGSASFSLGSLLVPLCGNH